jgi:hypothetical protein
MDKGEGEERKIKYSKAIFSKPRLNRAKQKGKSNGNYGVELELPRTSNGDGDVYPEVYGSAYGVQCSTETKWELEFNFRTKT